MKPSAPPSGLPASERLVDMPKGHVARVVSVTQANCVAMIRTLNLSVKGRIVGKKWLQGFGSQLHNHVSSEENHHNLHAEILGGS